MAASGVLPQVIDAARERNLFVLVSGSDRSLKYEFWDKKTGKLVFIYYPASGHWLAGQRDGNDPTLGGALLAGLGPIAAPGAAPPPPPGKAPQ